MSATALALPSPQAAWRPKVNPWAIAATVSMAAFIEVLDTSVANVALPYIAGGLGASYDDSTWVLTSYLAANAIVLPISGWLAELIGRKRYFMMSLAIFTVSSLLCGLAPNLPLLLLFRAVQGIGGGGLQPMAQAILNDTFPPEQRGSAFAVYGITAVLAPTVGPMLGGWITDNYSWRWIFFITLPVVLLALYLTYTLVEDPPFLRRLKRGGIRVDYIGISMLTLGVGSLQVVLDKGQEDDWFGSHFITTLAMVPRRANHRCPHVQELQFRGSELDDVHDGLHALQHPGLDSGISADAHGLHGRACRSRPLRRRSYLAGDDARRRPAHIKGSSPVADRDWMAVPCHWAVLLRAPD
jgi:MFS transporter, DHA2 family, multidrug resistance protein